MADDPTPWEEYERQEHEANLGRVRREIDARNHCVHNTITVGWRDLWEACAESHRERALAALTILHHAEALLARVLGGPALEVYLKLDPHKARVLKKVGCYKGIPAIGEAVATIAEWEEEPLQIRPIRLLAAAQAWAEGEVLTMRDLDRRQWENKPRQHGNVVSRADEIRRLLANWATTRPNGVRDGES